MVFQVLVKCDRSLTFLFSSLAHQDLWIMFKSVIFYRLCLLLIYLKLILGQIFILFTDDSFSLILSTLIYFSFRHKKGLLNLCHSKRQQTKFSCRQFKSDVYPLHYKQRFSTSVVQKYSYGWRKVFGICTNVSSATLRWLCCVRRLFKSIHHHNLKLTLLPPCRRLFLIWHLLLGNQWKVKSCSWSTNYST